MSSRFTGPLAALALVAAATGCASQEPYQAEYGGARVEVDLHVAGELQDVDVVWRDLWAGMAADPASQALIRRLYSDLPAALEGPATRAAAAPPGEIRLRVSDRGLAPVEYWNDSRQLLKGKRDVDLAVVGPPGLRVHVEAAAPRPGEDGQAAAAGGMVEASFVDLHLLRLAAAEYVARKLGEPWSLIADQGPIEQRIEDFCRRVRWSIDAD
ncbi:MAG: hypothetical protein M9894_27725 [Planctomycetes bacterium]|nr:hypothetical protein [Planctomycetota bacterium]